MRKLRRGLGGGAGLLAAALPVLVSAAEESSSRVVARPEDWSTAMLATVGAVLALFLTGALGWLYQQKRGLHWRFQDPDQPHGDADGEAAHH